MPVSEWPESAAASPATDGAGGVIVGVEQDTVRAHEQAIGLLRALHDAANRLGDAFVAAGFAPSEWRTTEALLCELSDQFPEATLDALLTRLAEFAAGMGPGWLRSDGAALDDFEHEVRVLGDVIRPLRALAQRQRMTPAGERGWLSFERALGDVRVGAQLDRLARTLRALMELAPRLAPLTPEELAALDGMATTDAAPPVAVPGAIPDPWTGQAMLAAVGAETPGVCAGTPPTTGAGIPIEDEGDDLDGPTYLLTGELPDAYPDAPTVPFDPSSPRLMRVVLGQRPRAWIVLLAIAASLLGGTAGLTWALNLPLGTPASVAWPTRTGARATAAAGALARAATATSSARARPPATAVPPAATRPARLAVSPGSVVLPCPSTGNAVTLTLSDTGGQSLNWQASAPANVSLSASAGTLAPGASTTIQAQATAPQHGSNAILFSSTGGSFSVVYKTACH